MGDVGALLTLLPIADFRLPMGDELSEDEETDCGLGKFELRNVMGDVVDEVDFFHCGFRNAE
jgi:hypothetical protein